LPGTLGALALSRRAGFRLLAHTADIGLEATAPTCGELFVKAAEGFRFLVYGNSPATEAIRLEVRLEAENTAELMVAWLNEILCLSEMTRFVPATFVILDLGVNRLTAVVTGEPFDPDRHAVERTAKAVTYHRLAVEERKTGWYARVYIDL
jgi:SHS2 domain-containing protein